MNFKIFSHLCLLAAFITACGKKQSDSNFDSSLPSLNGQGTNSLGGSATPSATPTSSQGNSQSYTIRGKVGFESYPSSQNCNYFKQQLNYLESSICAHWHIFNPGGSYPRYNSQSNSWGQSSWGQGVSGVDLQLLDVLKETNGKDTIVRILDSGVAYNHGDLKTNILSYVNGCNQSPNPPSTASHGTSVAGIISAIKNETGVVGIASGSKLQSVLYANSCTDNYKFFSPSNNHVFTNSMGSNSCVNGFGQMVEEAAVPTLMSAITDSANRNVLLHKSQGNNFQDCRNTIRLDQANHHHAVLSVGALNPNGTLSSYSAAGANVALCGFGGYDQQSTPGIPSTVDSGAIASDKYTDSFNGTSAATPTVAGVSALFRSLFPSAKWYEIQSLFLMTARTLSGQTKSANSSIPNQPNIYEVTNNYNYTHHWRGGFGSLDAKSALNFMRTSFRPMGELKNYSTHFSESFKNETLSQTVNNSCYEVPFQINHEMQIFAAVVKLGATGTFGNISAYLVMPDGVKAQFLWTSTIGGSVIPYSYQFLIRQPFGTWTKSSNKGNTSGLWKIIFCSSGSSATLQKVSLDFFGFLQEVIPKRIL